MTGLPPVGALITCFKVMEPIMANMQKLNNPFSVSKPEIKEIEIDGKPAFVVIQKHAFRSKEDAELFIKVANMVQAAILPK